MVLPIRNTFIADNGGTFLDHLCYNLTKDITTIWRSRRKGRKRSHCVNTRAAVHITSGAHVPGGNLSVCLSLE